MSDFSAHHSRSSSAVTQDMSGVIFLLKMGLLVFSWMVLAAHYNAIPSEFGFLAEGFRVLFVPAMMVVGYSVFATWVLGRVIGRIERDRRTWADVLVGLLTLAAVVAVSA